jgi:cytochrome P450
LPDLSVSIFYILNQPETLAKLRKELQSVVGDSKDIPSVTVLEKLPYLNATVAEGLRLSYGIASRLPRIRPNDSVQLRSVLKTSSKAGKKGQEVSYLVPPGYVLSMSAVHVHKNPDLFPEPDTFAPERWLDSAGKRRKDLDKYILSFSKGTRQCLGIKYVIPLQLLGSVGSNCCAPCALLGNIANSVLVLPTRSFSPALRHWFCASGTEWSCSRRRRMT